MTVHLTYLLGGCATAAAANAVTDPTQSSQITCPICLGALRHTAAPYAPKEAIMKTIIAAADQPEPDLYTAYRIRYQSLMASAASVLRESLRLTGRQR